MITEEYKKGVCQCRSCKRTFHQSEVVRIQTEHNGLERTCPHCGSNTYGLVEYPVIEEKLIYKSNFPSELKLHMDQVTDEILRVDSKRLKGQRAWERLTKERMTMA